MKILRNILIVGAVILNSSGFTQTKKELIDQVARQKVTIDSLNKVIANFENIVENRDRSINILKADTKEWKEERGNYVLKIREMDGKVADMRKQTKLGKSKMITLSNSRPTLKVPEGKYWVLNQFITDYMVDLVADSTGKMVGEEVHIFLRKINNDVLTDPSKNQYGPQVYSSVNSGSSMQFPITLTAGTSFSIVVMKGKMGALTEYGGKVHCSYFEKDVL
jgi:uncharacterized coiled-coil protein SlyX